MLVEGSEGAVRIGEGTIGAATAALVIVLIALPSRHSSGTKSETKPMRRKPAWSSTAIAMR